MIIRDITLLNVGGVIKAIIQYFKCFEHYPWIATEDALEASLYQTKHNLPDISLHLLLLHRRKIILSFCIKTRNLFKEITQRKHKNTTFSKLPRKLK